MSLVHSIALITLLWSSMCPDKHSVAFRAVTTVKSKILTGTRVPQRVVAEILPNLGQIACFTEREMWVHVIRSIASSPC